MRARERAGECHCRCVATAAPATHTHTLFNLISAGESHKNTHVGKSLVIEMVHTHTHTPTKGKSERDENVQFLLLVW
jgi:hypothetical protein